MPLIEHIDIPKVTKRGVRVVSILYGYGCKHPSCTNVWTTEDEAATCYETHEAVMPMGIYKKSKAMTVVYKLAEETSKSGTLLYCSIGRHYSVEGLYFEQRLSRLEIGKIISELPAQPEIKESELIGKVINLCTNESGIAFNPNRDGVGRTLTLRDTNLLTPEGFQLLQLEEDGVLTTMYLEYSFAEKLLAPQKHKYEVGGGYWWNLGNSHRGAEILALTDFVTLKGEPVYHIALSDGSILCPEFMLSLSIP